MNRTVAQAAQVLGVDGDQVKNWAWRFKQYLSGRANPTKGQPRYFTDSDMLALIYVAMHWEAHPDTEAIQIGLNSDDQFDDRYRDLLYASTPILQEPPEDLDETWRHGVFLNGAGVDEYLELARNYRQSAETLVSTALKSGEPREYGYPILFAYRHALELYLKVVGEIEVPSHSLQDCIRLVEKRHGETIGSPIREWIIEFDKIDPVGTAFRYADDEAGTLKYAEFWIDFLQLKFAMGQVFQVLDDAVRRSGTKGRAPKKAIGFVNNP